jgi:nitrogen regulatory protein P-II 2
VAIVRARGLDEIMQSLLLLRPRIVGIEQVRGYGRQKGHLETYGEPASEGGFLPKVRLEFTVGATQLDQAVEAVCQAARTGRIGDGKIFVHAVRPQAGAVAPTLAEVEPA